MSREFESINVTPFIRKKRKVIFSSLPDCLDDKDVNELSETSSSVISSIGSDKSELGKIVSLSMRRNLTDSQRDSTPGDYDSLEVELCPQHQRLGAV